MWGISPIKSPPGAFMYYSYNTFDFTDVCIVTQMALLFSYLTLIEMRHRITKCSGT